MTLVEEPIPCAPPSSANAPGSNDGEGRESGTSLVPALLQLIGKPPANVADEEVFSRALADGFAHFYKSWDARATDLIDPAAAALRSWCSEREPNLPIICELLDFLYFAVWCFSDSHVEQCRRLLSSMQAAVHAFERSAPMRMTSPPSIADSPWRVVWLAKFATCDDPISPALLRVAEAFASSDRFHLVVYAWRSPEQRFLDRLLALGVTCRCISAASAVETARDIEALAAEERPMIMISDDNTAVPTLAFCRRLAPVQIFAQHGLAAWPVRRLEAVFNSFGIDPKLAGWSGAEMLDGPAPWDAASLDQPADPGELARERATLPQGQRLIGCYGRLVKITPEYLSAVERILLRCPDAAFVTGGLGDGSAIEAFATASPVGDRMHVESRFVPGSIWGRLLHLFLDTWPNQGGQSCREVLAKGTPVVCMPSPEMPALARQRDAELVAENWDGFVERAIRLLENQDSYERACARSRALAEQCSDPAPFAARLRSDLSALVERHGDGFESA